MIVPSSDLQPNIPTADPLWGAPVGLTAAAEEDAAIGGFESGTEAGLAEAETELGGFAACPAPPVSANPHDAQ